MAFPVDGFAQQLQSRHFRIAESDFPLLKAFEQLLGEISPNHFFSAEKMRGLLNHYTPDEQAGILQDLDFNGLSIKETSLCKHYIVTAGEPSAGKSTLLESQLAKHFLDCPDPRLSNQMIQYVYIDSDRCLQNMQETYASDIALGKPSQKVYEHWKNASEFLTHFFLARALKKGLAIAHGSSLTAPQAIDTLKKIKIIYGYQTTIFHITCDELVREESEKRRGSIKKYSPTESIERRAAFFTNLKNYLEYSDQVFLCYRKDYQTSVWAARIQNPMKRITIYNSEALAEIQKIHDQAVESGFWESVFSGFSIDF